MLFSEQGWTLKHEGLCLPHHGQPDGSWHGCNWSTAVTPHPFQPCLGKLTLLKEFTLPARPDCGPDLPVPPVPSEDLANVNPLSAPWTRTFHGPEAPCQGPGSPSGPSSSGRLRPASQLWEERCPSSKAGELRQLASPRDHWGPPHPALALSAALFKISRHRAQRAV